MSKKPKSFYRFLLRDAWHLTCERKSLWVFGFFAALLHTGGIFDVLLHGITYIHEEQRFLEKLLHGSLPGYEKMVGIIAYVGTLPIWHTQLFFTFFFLGGILFLWMILMSQAALLTGLVSKKNLSFLSLIKEGQKNLWSLLGIHLFTKIVLLFFLFLTVLPLILFTYTPNILHGFVTFLIVLAFFIILFVMQFLSILGSVEIIRRKRSVFEAIHTAFDHLKKHGIVLFETALLLFFVGLLSTVLIMLILLLLLIPILALMVLSLLMGLSGLAFFFAALNIVLILFCLFLFSGALTTFSYAIWTGLSKQYSHKPLKGVLHYWLGHF